MIYPEMNETVAAEESWQDDPSLWYAFQNGDRLAFECMYQRHIQHLISYGFKITNDRDVIQDCIQDLFIELWDRRKTLSEVISIKHYLLKSLRYKIIRFLKNNNLEDLSGFELDGGSFETSMLNEESRVRQSQQLTAALGQLPKRQREAIHLRYFQELSNEEVARIMGVNYQSACKFIYTALRNLKENMLVLSVILSIC